MSVLFLSGDIAHTCTEKKCTIVLIFLSTVSVLRLSQDAFVKKIRTIIFAVYVKIMEILSTVHCVVLIKQKSYHWWMNIYVFHVYSIKYGSSCSQIYFSSKKLK